MEAEYGSKTTRRCNLAYLDLEEVPRDLTEKCGGSIEELDLSNNHISYPLNGILGILC